LENIILKSTAKDPFHRYESAEEMEKDLESAFDVSRITEPRFSIPEDDEATKAIPIITNENLLQHKIDDTIVRSPVNNHKIDQQSLDIKQNKKQNKKAKKDQKPRKRKSKFAIFIITTFLLLIIAGIAAFTIIPPLLLPKDIEVPDVSGESYEEAVSILLEKGFDVGEPILVTDEEVEEGYVIQTNPSANEITKEGATITIYESTGKEKLVLEDYVGRNIDRVKAILEMKGSKIEVIEESHESESAGTILTQSPEVGEEVVPSEDIIEFTVSSGPKLVEIEKLIGKSKAQVDEYVSSNGFNSNVTEEFSDNIPKGHLISQSHEPGKEVVPKETTLHLIYSLGPEKEPPKTVTKSVEIPYEPEEEGQELEVSIYIDDSEHSISETYETIKITSPLVRTLEFKIEQGQKAFYQIIIDNEVVTTETIPYPEE
jgi:serine/threonine-protein kinase